MLDKKKYLIILFVISQLFIIGCQKDDEYVPLVAEVDEEYSGGTTTIFITSAEAFGFKARGLDRESDGEFGVGNSLFRQSWVTAPASTTARDGLGPFFNARSCSTCHFKDGRGRAPAFNGEFGHGLLLRLSVSGTDAYGANIPEPTYGGQLQDQSILNATSEATFDTNYIEIPITYPDGSTASLRKPTYTITNLAFGELAPDLHISPRIAPQMIGLGLLDAIPETTLLSYADEFDSDNDGISGKPNYVWNIKTQSKTIGKYGWKANQPTIEQQVAAAFIGDMGLTSYLFPDNECPTGVNCDDFINGGEPEVVDESLARVVFYSSVLAVPGRRDFDNEEILEGKELFNQSNCTACHISKINTGEHPIPVVANQTIRPYTDLLLHDMGDGLSDNTSDFDATANEWKTPPLWGIGLIETVNGHTNLLHDGRARNIEEAILWHNGEAAASKNKFMELPLDDRTKLIDFIKSL